MKSPRERLSIWKRELRTMNPEEALHLLLDIAEQAIKQDEGGKDGRECTGGAD